VIDDDDEDDICIYLNKKEPGVHSSNNKKRAN